MSAVEFDRIAGLIREDGEKIRRIVFSKPRDREIQRVNVKPVTIGGRRFLQVETLRADNKAIHRNLALSEAPEILAQMAVSDFMQTNLLFTKGEAQVKVSAKGKITVFGSAGRDAAPADAASHNKEKNYLIDAAKYPEFLAALGVCDPRGSVYDKKRSKYRQINRFVELLDDVYDRLPKDGTLTVCDLCCGKSYLTFAIYFYLTKIKGRTVTLYGVDLKDDVIAFCADLAERLGYDGMHFLCQDVQDFDPGTPVDLVASLHACDTATDMVLAYAILHRAKLILSTPCCHHEIFHQLGQNPLHPIMKHSILKQKFADALTDALRALMLEARGYRTEAIELIDPEETPKNVLIRAVYTGKISVTARREYDETVERFGLSPALLRLLEQAEQNKE